MDSRSRRTCHLRGLGDLDTGNASNFRGDFAVFNYHRAGEGGFVMLSQLMDPNWKPTYQQPNYTCDWVAWQKLALELEILALQKRKLELEIQVLEAKVS